MFEPVYRNRPGADAMRPASAEKAEQIAPGLWCSPGLSNAYLLTTGAGRVIVNTGMGFEGPVHRANFDAVDSSPVRYIIFTQGHVDHVGGLDSVRDSDTTVVAQANWTLWRDDNERLIPYRASRSAFAFQDTLAEGIRAIQRRLGTKHLAGQSVPVVDVDFEDTLSLEVGGRRMELLAVPGGETNDSLVVWLPDERICLCGNVFGPIFGHIPNLVTMRGDRYRDALTAIASVERVRDLQPELLVTGHFEPIAGTDRIHAELTRLHDAIQYIHDQTVAGMNAGKDVRSLMREVILPPEYEVGQGLWKGRLGCTGDLGELLGLVPSPVDDRTLPGRFRCRRRRCGRTRWRRRPRGTGADTLGRGPTCARDPPRRACSTRPSGCTCSAPRRTREPADRQHELLGKSLADKADSEEFMTLRPEDFYHTGIVVPDLDAAMARLTALAGYRWINPLSYTLPFRTATGTRELTSTIVYSVQSPHIELVNEVPGTPWTAAPGNAVHHVGYFTDSLVESARMLESNGFTLEMTGDAPGSELSLFAYYVDSFGTRIEIVDRALFPDWPAFLQAASQTDGA